MDFIFTFSLKNQFGDVLKQRASLPNAHRPHTNMSAHTHVPEVYQQKEQKHKVG